MLNNQIDRTPFEQKLKKIVLDSYSRNADIYQHNAFAPFTFNPLGHLLINDEAAYKIHRKKFRPVMKQLQSRYGAEFHKFFITNFTHTFHRPISQNSLNRYYNSLLPNFRAVVLPMKYCAALNKIGTPGLVREAHGHAVDHVFNNREQLGETFANNKIAFIKTHEDLGACVELVSSGLENLTNTELDIIKTVAQNHEQFAFSTSEPYLMLMLGNALFFSIFVPLHRSGAFSFFIQTCVAKQFSVRNQFYVYLHRSPFINYITPKIDSRILMGSVASFLLGVAYTLRSYLAVPIKACMESTLIRDSVSSFIASGVGLGNPKVDYAKTFCSKAAFDLGSFVAGMSSNFVKGWLSKYSEVVSVAATAVDKTITQSKKD